MKQAELTPKRILTKTEDGSHTFEVKTLGQAYHSIHGAYGESLHIYIRSGLEQVAKNTIKVLEFGFGTGLNALLTMDYAHKYQKEIYYHTIEKYPLRAEEYSVLNYSDFVDEVEQQAFMMLHLGPWGQEEQLDRWFTIKKEKEDFRRVLFTLQDYDVVYFDAFSPESQPELWTPAVFSRIFRAMKPGGVLCTYSVKGVVKRALRTAGFRVEKLPGPPGKREILRAWR